MEPKKVVKSEEKDDIKIATIAALAKAITETAGNKNNKNSGREKLDHPIIDIIKYLPYNSSFIILLINVSSKKFYKLGWSWSQLTHIPSIPK